MLIRLPGEQRCLTLSARSATRSGFTAVHSELQATLASSAVAALEAAGVFRLKLPEVIDGAEADLMVQMEVFEALASIDTASAWCAMVDATSAALLGAYLPEPGLQSILRAGGLPLAAASLSSPEASPLPRMAAIGSTDAGVFAAGFATPR